MRRAAIVLLAWSAWLAVWTAAQLPFRTISGPFGLHGIETAMLGTSSFACFVAGLRLWILDRRGDGREQAPMMLSDESVATCAVAGGIALALLGAGFGLWLILIGAGLLAGGCVGLAFEARARRRGRGT
jgi:hypothetical protein